MYPDSVAPFLGTFVRDTLDFFGPEVELVYPGNSVRKKKVYFYLLLFWSAFRGAFRVERVVFHYPLFFSPLILFSCLLRRRVTLVYHGGEFMERPWSNSLFRLYQRLTMKFHNWCADDILLPSEFVSKTYFSDWENKVCVWYSGGFSVPEGLSCTSSDFDFDFVFVGRNSQEKGYDCFLEAIETKKVQESECLIAIVSRDVTVPYVERVGNLNVRYFPAMPQKEIAFFISRSRFIVIPSRAESLCLLALEAASLGVVVLARGLEPIKETLGDSAFYYDQDNELPELMADVVSFDFDRWRASSSKLQSRSKKFNRKVIHEKFDK